MIQFKTFPLKSFYTALPRSPLKTLCNIFITVFYCFFSLLLFFTIFGLFYFPRHPFKLVFFRRIR